MAFSDGMGRSYYFIGQSRKRVVFNTQEVLKMRIIKDGSVFRVALESGGIGPETRISFAVNTHGDLKRPRVEVSGQELAGMFRDMLPHLSAQDLFTDRNIPSVVRMDTLEGLLRILHQFANASLEGDKEMWRTSNGKICDTLGILSKVFAELATKTW